MNEQQQQKFKKLLFYSDTKESWLLPVFSEYKKRQWLYLYHDALANLYKSSDFAGISDASQQKNIALADIYVKERFTTQDLSQLEGKDNFDQILKQTVSDELEDLLITFDHEQRPKKINKSAVIIGAAGSGKSTLVKILAVACSGQANQLPLAQHFGRRLMMPFILREMQLTEVKTVNDLLEVWAQEFERKTGIDKLIDLETVKYFLQQGWGIIAFDGVDEIGIKYRRRIRRLVYAFKATYPDAAIFVTGRPVGFERLPFNAPKLRLWQAIAKREGWETVPKPPNSFTPQHVRPFDIYQVTNYVTAWYKARYDTDKVKQRIEYNLLLEALKNHTGLKTLKYRPIYLATLTYVHDVKGKLPNSQVLAYESMVDAYLDVLDTHKRLDQNGCHEESIQFDRLDKWKVLERLAHDLHNKEVGESGTEKESPFNTRLSKVAFKPWLTFLIENNKVQLKLKITEIDKLLNYFLARSGLLVQPEEGVLMFSHLSFQEFLVGSWVFRELGNNFLNPAGHLNKELFNQLATKNTWHPVGLSFFGLQTQKQGGDFQFQIIKQLWLDEDKEEKISTPTSFNFINRVLKEGEHTLTAKNIKNIWESHWNCAILELNDNWMDSFNNTRQQWNLWQQEENYIEDFLQQRLTNLNDKCENAANELILFSTCPKEFLNTAWQQQENLVERWRTIIDNDEIKYSLDLHAAYPKTISILKIAFSLETILLATQESEILSLYYILKYENQEYNELYYIYQQFKIIYYQLSISDSLNWDRHIRYQRKMVKIRNDVHKFSLIAQQALVIFDEIEGSTPNFSQDYNSNILSSNLAWVYKATIMEDLNLVLDPNQTKFICNGIEKPLFKLLTKVSLLLRTVHNKTIIIYDIYNWENNVSKIITLWILHQVTVSYKEQFHIFFTTPQQAIDTLEQAGQESPEFAALFDKDWFPYQRLKELAQDPHPVEPIEANTHRLYHYLRYKLDQAGQYISDLPENLDLKAGDSIRQWHGDEVADQYIKDFTAAGWDGQMPPHDVDRWIKEDQALEAKQKAEKDQES